MAACNQTILIVDDEEPIRESLSRLLKMNNFDVMTADSGQQALDILLKIPVDLVISDHRMPEMSGLELMMKIREAYPDIVLIMLTAFSEKTVMQKAINQGEIFRFFFKPWDDNELLTAVKQSLERKAYILEERKRIVSELQRSNIETVMALAEAIELKDSYTKGHCSRVRDFSLQMARAVGLPNELLIHLVYGALLHDCGKIGITENVLLKPGKLSDIQRKIIENHSVLGFELTNPVSHLKTASLFIRQHHERWDGKGYPDGLEKGQIHICSRIISIADTFDAMTSDRPYRKGMDIQKARQILLESRGSQFDPELVDAFVAILDDKGIEGMLNHAGINGNNNVPAILFVDDEAHILTTMNRLFMTEDYHIMTAGGADQALDILSNTCVDIVVSDQKMPGMTGVEFLTIIKSKCPGTVRIMLSGYADLNEAMAAINDAGIYKFIMKPWKDDELRTTIRNALEWKQMSQNVYDLVIQ